MPQTPTPRASRSSIKIINGALEERDSGAIVLRGSLDPQSLRELKVGSYQREVVKSHMLSGLGEALMLGRTPDVILGMRGQHYTTRDNDFFLQDEVYIIDGYQRVEAAKRLLPGEKPPQLGALVYFSTNEVFERAQFNVLNTTALKLSPNVFIRNMRQEKEAVAILYQLCHEKTFPLYDKVTWSQSTKRNDLISATTMLKTIGRLHTFLDIPGIGNHRVFELSDALTNVVELIGKNVFRSNVHTFFQVIDLAWGVRSIYKKDAIQLRYGFLFALADLFARHYDFWTGNEYRRFFVMAPMIRKLSHFKITVDPVKSLANAGSGQASNHLRQLLTEHLDKGKRTGRLRPREVVEEDDEKPAPAPLLVNGEDKHAVA